MTDGLALVSATVGAWMIDIRIVGDPTCSRWMIGSILDSPTTTIGVNKL